MIDSARIQAAIEILEQVEASLSHDGASADVLIRKYFRTRRYAGSKDRRSVTERVYAVIRNWGYLVEVANCDIRKMVLLSLAETNAPDEIEKLFNGGDHGPAVLSEDEKSFLTIKPEKSDHQRLNYPLWLEGRLKARFGEGFEAELDSLNGRAPFDLRVNLAKTTRDKVAEYLSSEDIDHRPGKWAETALVLSENRRIDAWDIYKNGHVEIQDEAAQLAIDLCDIQPGQQVMDLCAGAGGKTLAAAARMNNKGQIYAFDNNYHRLKDLKPRAKRAGAHILQARELDTAGGKRDKILAEYTGHMDRVILDVPCSGSGVWRRNPELKWRLTDSKLDQYCRIQKHLLTEGWGFVKPGGRMIYMTCSLFEDENEQQVTDFLATQDKARLVPFMEQYRNSELRTLSSLPGCLAISPHSHGTDGFFVAIFEKTTSN